MLISQQEVWINLNGHPVLTLWFFKSKLKQTFLLLNCSPGGRPRERRWRRWTRTRCPWWCRSGWRGQGPCATCKSSSKRACSCWRCWVSSDFEPAGRHLKTFRDIFHRSHSWNVIALLRGRRPLLRPTVTNDRRPNDTNDQLPVGCQRPTTDGDQRRTRESAVTFQLIDLNLNWVPLWMSSRWQDPRFRKWREQLAIVENEFFGMVFSGFPCKLRTVSLINPVSWSSSIKSPEPTSVKSNSLSFRNRYAKSA